MELLQILAIINIGLCGLNAYSRFKRGAEFSGWIVAILGWFIVALP